MAERSRSESSPLWLSTTSGLLPLTFNPTSSACAARARAFVIADASRWPVSGTRPDTRTTLARSGCSRSRCNRASGTKSARTGAWVSASENSPRRSGASTSRTVTRRARLMSSRRPCRTPDGMAEGFCTRTTNASPTDAPSSSASVGLASASLAAGPRMPGRPWKRQNRSSTPNTCTEPARRPLGVCVTTASKATSGAARWIAPLARRRSSASASRANVGAVTITSVAPSRSSARRLRLERTESPTTSAPARTETATAAPATAGRFVRQNQVRLRRTSAPALMPCAPRAARLRDESGEGVARPAPGCA
jgi:hypothetical protein